MCWIYVFASTHAMTSEEYVCFTSFRFFSSFSQQLAVNISMYILQYSLLAIHTTSKYKMLWLFVLLVLHTRRQCSLLWFFFLRPCVVDVLSSQLMNITIEDVFTMVEAANSNSRIQWHERVNEQTAREWACERASEMACEQNTATANCCVRIVGLRIVHGKVQLFFKLREWMVCLAFFAIFFN